VATVSGLVGRIVSGGQTGVDRAALDVAGARGVPAGGWCPKGRRAEDGAIPARYPLHETASDAYEERTELNVRDSDATLILNRGPLEGGTGLTAELARRMGRPCLVVDLGAPGAVLPDEAAATAAAWLAEIPAPGRPITLNVAGPRESKAPGVGEQAARFLARVLDQAGDLIPPPP